MLQRRTIYQTACLALIALCVSCTGLPFSYRQTSNNGDVAFEQMFEVVRKKRVVFIGEAHTSFTDHSVQMEVIRWLREEGHGVSVVLEMFTPNEQPALDQWVQGKLDENSFESIYRNGWDIPYWYYRDIFLFAREKGIRLYGINAGASFIAQVAREGLDGLSEQDLSIVKYTPCSESPGYAHSIGVKGISSPHGADMSYLCDAQRLRDSIMAYNIFSIMRQDDNIMVVLLGSGHAIRQAVPALLMKHLPELPYLVLLPEDIRLLTGRRANKAAADYTW